MTSFAKELLFGVLFMCVLSYGNSVLPSCPADDAYLHHTVSCNYFFHCALGHPFEKRCPLNLVFSTVILTCVYPGSTYDDCSGKIPGGSQGTDSGENQNNNSGENQGTNTGGSQGTNTGGSQGTTTGGSQGTNSGENQNTNTGGSQGTNTGGSQGTNNGGSQGTNSGENQNTNTGGSQGTNSGENQNTNTGGSQGTNTGGSQGTNNGGSQGTNNGGSQGSSSEEKTSPLTSRPTTPTTQTTSPRVNTVKNDEVNPTVSARQGEVVHIFGGRSNNRDGGRSAVACPSGSIVLNCDCSSRNGCDGSRITGTICNAFNGQGGSGQRALGVCYYDDRRNWQLINSGVSRFPEATCSTGFKITACTILNGWAHLDYIRPYADAVRNSCSVNKRCLYGTGCSVQAICRRI